MTTVSKTFIAALKLAPEPAYRYAARAKMHPTTLSRIIHGAEPARIDDRRLLRIAVLLGVPAGDIFAHVPEGDEVT